MQHAGWMSCAVWLLQLPPSPLVLPLTPDGPVHPFRHCSLVFSAAQRDSYDHLQGPEEQGVFVQHMEGDAGAVIAVQPLFLFGREISQQFSIITWLYMRCLPAKGPGPSPSAGGPTVESHANSDNATSDQTAWQFVTLVS